MKKKQTQIITIVEFKEFYFTGVHNKNILRTETTNITTSAYYINKSIRIHRIEFIMALDLSHPFSSVLT